MKRTIVYLLIVSTFLLFSACSKKGEVVDELIEYHNKILLPLHVNSQAETNLFQQKLLNLYKEEDEQGLIQLLKKEVIPSTDKSINELESNIPKHREVKKLNKLQIKTEKFKKTSLQQVIEHFEGNVSESELRRTENDLTEKYNEILDYRDKLMDKYDLEFDKAEEHGNGFYELKRVEK